MFGFNPYALLAGGAAVLGVVFGYHVMDGKIHKYHTMYNCAEFATDCEKNTKIVKVPELQADIVLMKRAQSNQIAASQKAVDKIVYLPAKTKTVIKEVHDTPVPKDCTSPEFPQDVKDSY
jgi:hypothetical protein